MQNNLTKNDLTDIHFYLMGALSYYNEWAEKEQELDLPEQDKNQDYIYRQIHKINMLQEKITDIIKEGI